MFPPPSLPPAPELFNTSPQKLFPEPSPKDICMNSGMYRCTFLKLDQGVLVGCQFGFSCCVAFIVFYFQLTKSILVWDIHTRARVGLLGSV